MLRVLVALLPAVTVTDAGFSEHVTSEVVDDGVHERLTVPLKPPPEETVTVDVPVWPAVNVSVVGLAFMWKLGTMLAVGHAFTSFWPSIVPRPVTRSYPTPAV